MSNTGCEFYDFSYVSILSHNYAPKGRLNFCNPCLVYGFFYNINKLNLFTKGSSVRLESNRRVQNN